MSQNIEDLVGELSEKGFGYIPIDSQKINEAKDAARCFIESLVHVHGGWKFTRPGEHEPDVGVIDKAGKDIKTYFHSAHDLGFLKGNKPATSQQIECLRVMDGCRYLLETLGLDIAACLAGELGLPNLKQLVRESAKLSSAYNVSTLRLLSYPDVSDQKGARAHYDRSFLTMHLGDSGGSLLIQNKAGMWEYASPPQGSALVFFGVKILELTNGKFEPILHKSTTARGKERTAAVMFIHTDIGRQVSDAEAEYKRFHAQ